MSESITIEDVPTVYHGRSRVLCTPGPITAENVRELIDRSLLTHSTNAAAIDYLHRYFLGYQPVLSRVKSVREEINNKVVENRAYQICKDRADALAGEPIAYSAHGASRDCEGADDLVDELSHKVQALNDYCDMADKHACDIELVQWLCECGVAYRLVLPTRAVEGGDGAPFMMASLDPRDTFVAYTNDVYREPYYAVTFVRNEVTHDPIYTLYTADRVFIVDPDSVTESANPLGMVPIIEYDANSERMGVFEAVLSLLDAINEVESNRVDGVAQFVQSLMVLENVEFEGDDGAEEFTKMLRLGCVQIHSTQDNKASVTMLVSELNQDQTQTLVDSLYKTVLSICGMPFNVGGSGSTSDTGAAVTMRDGWSNSESRCKETEVHFKRGERRFLKAVCRILDVSEGMGLQPSQVEIKFTRRNYEAIQSKAQVLTTLLGCGKVHPRLAFEHCGMFPDPENAYDLSQRYVDEQSSKARELPNEPDGDGADGDSNVGGDVTAAGQGTRPPSTKRSDDGKDNQ